MSVEFTLYLLAVACGLTCHISEAISWYKWLVSDPPPKYSLQTENLRYVRDEYGNLKLVNMNDMILDSGTPFTEKDVIFQLYTRANPNNAQNLTLHDKNGLINSHFNPKLPTRMFIHGWYSEGLLTPRFANAYLTKGDFNFIAVNWQKGSDILNYLQARQNIKIVGVQVAHFISFLAEMKMVWELFEMSGHSLGAHTMGIAGKYINIHKKIKVVKMTGLDPALPRFDYNDKNERLDKSDAHYVEVIVTCAGMLGFDHPILAHATFYPNSGFSQPGCRMDLSGACDHGRAYEFFLESIIHNEFYAFQCANYDLLHLGVCDVINDVALMGGEGKKKIREGIFYLKTNEKPQYAQGLDGLHKAFPKKEEKIRLDFLFDSHVPDEYVDGLIY